ncbi:unnamed protein product [Calicophoron daubneyi]|uniref:Kinesin motor domain-containing protein n=1 Tax=Calicophoron daubneyi TaxID=300641 RepID=A0AAV2T8X3_CALDB
MSQFSKNPPNSGIWRGEGTVGYVSPYNTHEQIGKEDLRFPSETTQLWVNEYLEQMSDNPIYYGKNLPPSPNSTGRERSRRNAYTLGDQCCHQGNEHKGKSNTESRMFVSNNALYHRGDNADVELLSGPVTELCTSDSQTESSSTNSKTDSSEDSQMRGNYRRQATSDSTRTSYSSITLSHGHVNTQSKDYQEICSRQPEKYEHPNVQNKCDAKLSSRRSISYRTVGNDCSTSEVRRSRTQLFDQCSDQGSKRSVEHYPYGWPTPIPIKSTGNAQLMNSTLDTMSVFKYRIHYPDLTKWTRYFMSHYRTWRTSGIVPSIDDPEPVSKSAIGFIQEALKKRIQKLKETFVDENGKIGLKEPPVKTLDSVNGDSQKNQLWKRRYYTLLNAVDFVYKDYQLLHYVSKEGLFEFVSNPPATPKMPQPNIRDMSKPTWPSSRLQNDVQTLTSIGADPAGHLSTRITQLLIHMADQRYNGYSSIEQWPCSFRMSVAFLSDVIAQSRILRNDLDRRLAVHDRLIYVLGQAREQRAKLKLHMLKQRDLISALSANLEAARQRLLTISPVQDLPSSINDGLANTIASPFVDFETAESDKTDFIHRLRNICYGEPNLVLSGVDGDIIEYKQKIADIQYRISGLDRALKEEESRRRRLHNSIQELTGNIRVYCRLRPDSSRCLNEHGDPQKPYLRVSSDDRLLFCPDTLRERLEEQGRSTMFAYNNSIRTAINAGSVTSTSGCGTAFASPRCFIFDRVFGPTSTQDDIYQEVDDLIISCVDGYNVCIMAYGQTGSGKTYTMMGTPEEPGVNRRAVRSLYKHCEKRKQWKFSIYVSMIEIYQEDVFDLLEDSEKLNADLPHADTLRCTQKPTAASNGCRRLYRSESRRWKQTIPWNAWSIHTSAAFGSFPTRTVRRRGSVRILSDHLDGVVLQNLHEKPVNNEQDMLNYIALAEKQRHTGSTRLNICSSRSHMIIILRVIGENELQRTTSRGTLTLADLAGSENVTKSGSKGERFMEAACINKSLSALGRVFDALRRQQKPTYRETKLTYLLRPSLGGESKCLLVVTLRSEPEHAEETWRAVHFGQGALQVIPGGGGISNQGNEIIQPDGGYGTKPSSSAHSYSPNRTASPPVVSRKIHGRRKTKNSQKDHVTDSSFLPTSVYSMGPPITRRGWR